MFGNSGDLGQLNCSNDVSNDVSTPSGFACSIAQGMCDEVVNLVSYLGMLMLWYLVEIQLMYLFLG